MAGLNAVHQVLPNGSMSSNQSGEGDIRRALIEVEMTGLGNSTSVKCCNV